MSRELLEQGAELRILVRPECRRKLDADIVAESSERSISARERPISGVTATQLLWPWTNVLSQTKSTSQASHNEHEYTTDEDIVAGLAMLTEVVDRLCNGVLEG